jgi:GT2 family glycosyltransferase
LRTGRVGVAVLDHGRPEDTLRAVQSSLEPALAPVVVVVENGMADRPALPPGVDFLRLRENVGYAGGMNAGIAHLRRAGCELFLLLNNDAVLEPGCLKRLAEVLEDPSLAAAGPVVLREQDGRVESRGARFDRRSGRFRLLGHGQGAQTRPGIARVPALSGAVWMLKASALDRVGPLEESYFWSFEDADWCARARRAGLDLAVALDATARHGGSRTLGIASPDRLYYAARNHLLAATRVHPLPGPVRFARSAIIVILNVTHALTQRQVPLAQAIRAVAAGVLDFRRGRSGPRVKAS